MGLSRRFLNLIVDNGVPGVRSLRRIRPARLFYPTTADGSEESGGEGEQDTISGLAMGTIPLPRPTFKFRASSLNNEWKMDCFPLADGKVICADQSGRGFLFDADTRLVKTMPTLEKPKVMPVSLFIPDAEGDGDVKYNGWGSRLFLMERFLKLESESETKSDQFEAYIFRKPFLAAASKSWYCHHLTPPPFVHDTCNWKNPQISSYAVVGGGSHNCISVDGVGTYLLDTKSLTWNEVGKWTLPFNGKVEYVSELDLWFGLSADGQHLAAVDLSAMDPQPQLIWSCKELDVPEEWKECKDSQLVNLGSGRFCIARFFQTETTMDPDLGDNQNFTVLTGVQVMKHIVNGKVELRMVPHQSRRVNSGAIETLF